jgi:N-acetylated-alpha-linked acidic dipeptidase
MPLYPGDPLTPGVGATPEATRLPRESAPTLTKIPVLPIGYADAQPLLAALGGAVVPPEWRGALPITYRMGPGPATVHLKVAFDWQLAPAYDVIARVRGSVYPDEWIIRGNHHDAWVFGAADPLSGMVALLEEARAIGTLMRSGWRPQRTIVFAAWDAEEPGLLGSTEWAEAHAEELGRHAVAYINTDASGRGFLGAGGSHTLERLVSEIAADVPDPQTGVSIAERLRARLRVGGRRAEADRADLELYPLGSGSDYTPFLQHLGIASLNLGFGGESDGGEYHSIYDSFDHYRRFGDPTFAYGVALAKTAGRATLRLSEAAVLPFRLANLADRVGRYAREVMELEQRLRDEAEQRNDLLASRAYQLAADPTRTSVPPDSLSSVPYLNFAPLRNAVDRLTARAAAADSLLAGALGASPATREAMNALVVRTERAMIRADGLPRRPWFRHHVYAPGFYTGYGVKTLPGVREALEQRAWPEAEAQIAAAAAALDALSAVLAEIVALRPIGP